MRQFIAVILLLIFAGAGAAQTTPNFSGHWTIILPEAGGRIATEVSGGAVNCGTECTIVQTADTLTISRPASPSGAKRPDVVLDLSGHASSIAQSAGSKAPDSAAAKWNDRQLIVTHSAGTLTVTQILFVEDGKLKITSAFTANGAPIAGIAPATLSYAKAGSDF